MSLLQKAHELLSRLNLRLPRTRPTLAQLQHIDLFLESWEKKFVGALGALAIIALGGVAWSVRNLSTVPAPAEGGDLQEVLIGNPRHLNPLFATTDADRAITNIVFLPLCDSFNRGVPALATQCEFNGAKTVTITLAERSWHDGEPVSSADVIFTLQAMQNKEVGSPWYELARWVSVGTDNEGRIVINARQPIPELKTLMTLGSIPAHVWRDVPPRQMVAHELNLHPVGSGPFTVTDTIADRDGYVQVVNLEAFEDYLPRRAFLDEIVFRIAADHAAAYDMFRTRQVDALFATDPAEAQELVKRDVQRYEITPPIVVSLFFNQLHQRAFRTPAVREAIVRAIDRAAIVKDSLKEHGVPTRAPFPTSMLKNPTTLQVDTEVMAAREVFKKNPLGNASSTLLIGTPPLPTYESVAHQIVSQLATVGVNASISAMSIDNTKDVSAHDLVLFGQDYGAAGNAASYWHSSASGNGGANYARYQIREVDTWLEQLQTDGRPEARAALLEKINKRIVYDDPAVFLFQPVYQYYVSNKVRGVTVDTAGDPSDRFRTVSAWYTRMTRE